MMSEGNIGSNFMIQANQRAEDHSSSTNVQRKAPNTKTGSIKSGRQRKKTATRAKGGEFRARTEKKRVYFCCISSEMEMEGLHEELKMARPMEWQVTMYTSVLHIYIPGSTNSAEIFHQSSNEGEYNIEKEVDSAEKPDKTRSLKFEEDGEVVPDQNLWSSDSKEVFIFDFGTFVFWGFTPTEEKLFLDFARKFMLGDEMEDEEFDASEDDMAYIGTDMASVLRDGKMSSRIHNNPIASYDMSTWETSGTGIGVGLAWEKNLNEEDSEESGERRERQGLHEEEARTFSEGEESRVFSDGDEREKSSISPRESPGKPLDLGQSQQASGRSGTSISPGMKHMQPLRQHASTGHIFLENDVYTVSKFASPRERLALSFAMAQSSILAVFESRIQKRVEEYRYIPETYAANGKVRISGRRLGNMIGEVFVVRHDVNLHTEILDTPDWFWNNRDVENLYKMVSAYLEMDSRTAILNKRLDLLREMLTMLQLQHENHHTNKLEWIVIILILASIVVEVVTVLGKYLKYWN